MSDRLQAECDQLHGWYGDAQRQVAALREALQLALVCKGEYQGTTETDGGYPAICASCAEKARAALYTEDAKRPTPISGSGCGPVPEREGAE